ncbi:MAG TPA: NTP transferase domain-containing protein [Candidatus Andersenbacteria bacterium]|nr:NTP transferase domain-containing protein [Candidatus Andersenbacteria bacterium]
MYKLLITTSGTGSRLGGLTAHTNKALVQINGKPTISHILDHYNPSIPIVITIGYLGQQVRDFFAQQYPNRDVEFAVVDPYEGPGSSLGYSLLQAEQLLQCPFIFHACDTILTQQVPAPDKNWAAGYVLPAGMDATQYRTHKVQDGRIIALRDKGESDFNAIHIGVTGIASYKEFWDTLHRLYASNPEDTGWSDVHVVDAMIKQGIPFKSVLFDPWLDTGNLPSLAKTQEYFEQTKK